MNFRCIICPTFLSKTEFSPGSVVQSFFHNTSSIYFKVINLGYNWVIIHKDSQGFSAHTYRLPRCKVVARYLKATQNADHKN